MPPAARTGPGSLAQNREAVPVDAELRALEREQFDDAAEFECAEAIVGERNDEVIEHGAMLPEFVDRATAARCAEPRYCPPSPRIARHLPENPP